MKRNRLFQVLLSLAFLIVWLSGSTAPALAQSHHGATFEIFAGAYQPEDNVLDTGATFGLRGGYRYSDAFGFEGSVSAFHSDLGPGVDVDFGFFDASFKWYPGSGGKKNELLLFGGPGWSRVDASAQTIFGNLSVSDDSATAHIGIGGELHVGNRWYLRPEARARYFDKGGDVDTEATLAVGFTF